MPTTGLGHLAPAVATARAACPSAARRRAAERMAAELGPHEVRIRKSQILSFTLPRNLDSPRFKQIVHPSAGTWMHHLELTDSSQLDAEVRGWMLEAYGAAG
ncbi:DUF5655 domain-containing protein [Pseudarthrobacter sp. alpha12b]